MPDNVLPLERIKAMTPCTSQWRAVQEWFPDGVPLTWETIQRAEELGLSVVWCMARILPVHLAPALVRVLYRKAHAEFLALLESGQVELDEDVHALWADIPGAPPSSCLRALEADDLASRLDEILFTSTFRNHIKATKASWLLRVAASMHAAFTTFSMPPVALMEAAIAGAKDLTGSHELVARWVLQHVYGIPQG